MASPNESLGDSQLVARIQAGDQLAFNELHRRYHRRLVAFLKPKCLGQLDPFDVAQEVWMRVWKALERYEDKSFSGWLFEIARNFLKDMYKKGVLKTAPFAEGHEPVAPQPKPDNPELDALQECLKSIKSNYVEVLVHTLYGLTTDEIARMFGITSANVDKWRFNGRKLVKDCVEQKLK